MGFLWRRGEVAVKFKKDRNAKWFERRELWKERKVIFLTKHLGVTGYVSQEISRAAIV
jgi:hypothetical protein